MKIRDNPATSESYRDLRDTPVTVIGAARSGLGVAKLLASVGARVFVSDNGDPERVKPYTDELDRFTIPYETGKHSEQVYDAELIVISPGVLSDAPVVREAENRGITVVSELEVASWYCRVPIIAVTGTNGKTTTTTLIGRMLHDAKRLHIVAGNIGDAFSNHAAQLNSNSIAVVEVSSFQLDHIRRFKPKVSVILNITPDHLNRYGNVMERYVSAKGRVFMNQDRDDVLIFNADDPVVTGLVGKAQSRTLGFSTGKTLSEGAYLENDALVIHIGGKKQVILHRSEILLPGFHNIANALAASLAVSAFGVQAETLKHTLSTFRGVEHRLEFVLEINGVRFVNDSKATNVESTLHALRSFTAPLVLMLGGRDKGNDYTRIDPYVKQQARAIIALGESAGKIEEHFKNMVKVVRVGSMSEAVEKSLQLAHGGDTVLLSPACASFDWFENYERRGQVFKESVYACAERT
jgi:UDP-N-acetylmuramoylalanine--D-glutamate ligase